MLQASVAGFLRVPFKFSVIFKTCLHSQNMANKDFDEGDSSFKTSAPKFYSELNSESIILSTSLTKAFRLEAYVLQNAVSVFGLCMQLNGLRSRINLMKSTESLHSCFLDGITLGVRHHTYVARIIKTQQNYIFYILRNTNIRDCNFHVWMQHSQHK